LNANDAVDRGCSRSINDCELACRRWLVPALLRRHRPSVLAAADGKDKCQGEQRNVTIHF